MTTGKAFVTNYKGLVFEPQVQLIYQSVSFSEAVDVDGLNVQFDRPDQFTMRVGGRFGKKVASLQKGHFVSFYGRAHLTSSYGGDQFVYIHDAFRLGAFGSAIEGGFGVNAQLTSAVMVYGDLVYKHKLSTFGFTGTSVSGGLRYRF
ncbi:autotransporter outer membrane beta-barrel domain-containing protein [Bartonella bacilliformis]|uniref:autotransporter outer membrane beta-barrel domain-containing protein n=1 Tax=Bartonella bacilliformis TaxID=774 RepID=UPI0039E6F78A